MQSLWKWKFHSQNLTHTGGCAFIHFICHNKLLLFYHFAQKRNLQPKPSLALLSEKVSHDLALPGAYIPWEHNNSKISCSLPHSCHKATTLTRVWWYCSHKQSLSLLLVLSSMCSVVSSKSVAWCLGNMAISASSEWMGFIYLKVYANAPKTIYCRFNPFMPGRRLLGRILQLFRIWTHPMTK